jgi:4-amino-4-deoxy-L-arabinose transferase-like glycosyltransferase
MNTRYKFNSGLIWVVLISIGSLLIHFFTYNNLGFHRDELLYLALGRHLSAGYWSNPPLIGIISYISQLLPGDSLFTTRLIPALAGALLIILTGLTARELGGKGYAQILACVTISTSLLILRGFSMLQPVPFDILLWSLILYLFLRYINSSKPVYILLIGVTFGLGMLNKYMVIFLAAGLAIAVLPTQYRKLWINKYTGYALLIAVLLFLPNLVWQINHGFPVMIHMKELAEDQLVNVKRINILIDQVLMFTIGSVVWIAGLIFLLKSENAKKYRVFGYTYLAILFIFLLLRGKSYYMAGLYAFLFAAGGVCWEKVLKPIWTKIVFAVMLVLISLPIVPGGIPLMPADKLADYFSRMPPQTGIEALLRWEDGKTHPLPQDFADMLGWDELGNIVINACDTIHDKNRIMIYTENYGQAGAIEHFGKSYGLNEVASFSDNYFLWIPDTIPSNKDLFFYVNDELGSEINSLFVCIDSLGSITNPFAREQGTTVYLCRSPRADFGRFWARRVREVKRKRKVL